MALKWGPEGGAVRSKEYYRHMAWCRNHKIYVTYDEYVEKVRTGSKYGPPGVRFESREAQSHRRYCNRNGWVSWDRYVEISPRFAAELEPDEVAARAERNREKFRRLGLVA